MQLSQIEVYSPNTLEEALRYLQVHTGKCRVISGGTDVLIELKDDIFPSDRLVSLHRLRELRYVKLDGEKVRIGALATITDLLNSQTIRSHARPLYEVGAVFGSLQIRNKATVAGNIGRASPAGDCIPPLYSLKASVVLQSTRGSRVVPIEEFFLGPRKTLLMLDELIVEVYFDRMDETELGFFEKLGLRNANAIAVVSAAAFLRPKDSDRIEAARIALGSVAPTVIRARKAEELLTSRSMDDEDLRTVCDVAGTESKPISDVRGSAEYRRSMVSSILYKGLYRVLR